METAMSKKNKNSGRSRNTNVDKIGYENKDRIEHKLTRQEWDNNESQANNESGKNNQGYE